MHINHFINRLNSPILRGSIFLSTCLIFGITTPVQAQLEEIIVTAQKREESLQDAPVAITAFTGDELDRAGVVDPESLAEMIPNVDVNSEGNRDGLIIVMRGVAGTDVRNGADPTTAFHVDGNYVPRLSGANAYFFDTERIEVLRGPQGTLYGRNSTAGVLNVITKKPSLDGIDGNVEFGFGNHDQVIGRGALNIPLGNNFAVRGAVMYNFHDGYVESVGVPGSTALVTKDANDADEKAFRGHLLWEPTENTSALFTYERYERNGAGLSSSNLGCLSEAELAPFGLSTTSPTQPTGATIVCNNSSDPADTNAYNTQPYRDNHDNNFRGEINHSFSFGDLFYQAAFRSHNRDSGNEGDGGAIIANGTPATSTLVEKQQSDTWSHEVRLSSSSDGPFQWLVGGFYMEETIDGNFQVFLPRDPTRNAGMFPPTTVPNQFGFDQQIVQFVDKDLTNESVAVFFNGSYDINDALTFNGGIRWTRDEKNKGGMVDPATGLPAATGSALANSGSNFCVSFLNTGTNGAPAPGQFNNCGSSVADSRVDGGIAQVSNPEWNQTTWTAGLDWQVNDDMMAYVKVGTGFKSGGWNRGSQGTTLDGTLFVFEPETVLAYEGGLKWDMLDGRGRLNLAGFFYDYEDMQVSSIITPPSGVRTNITNNAASSEVWGIEAEGQLVFGDTGSARIALGYLNTEFIEFPGFQDDFTSTTIDVTGNELARSPEFNMTFSIVPMTFQGLGGTWTPQLQFHYETESFFGTVNRGIPINGHQAGLRESYTKTNVTLGYEHEGGNWYAEGYVYNLEDDDIFNSSGCGSAVAASAGPTVNNPVYNCTGAFEPPRLIGIRFGYRM